MICPSCGAHNHGNAVTCEDCQEVLARPSELAVPPDAPATAVRKQAAKPPEAASLAAATVFPQASSAPSMRMILTGLVLLVLALGLMFTALARYTASKTHSPSTPEELPGQGAASVPPPLPVPGAAPGAMSGIGAPAAGGRAESGSGTVSAPATSATAPAPLSGLSRAATRHAEQLPSPAPSPQVASAAAEDPGAHKGTPRHRPGADASGNGPADTAKSAVPAAASQPNPDAAPARSLDDLLK